KQSGMVQRGIPFDAYRLVVHRTAHTQYFSDDIILDIEVINLCLNTHSIIFKTSARVDLIRYFVLEVRIPDIIISIKTVVDIISISLRHRRCPMTISSSNRKIKTVYTAFITRV